MNLDRKSLEEGIGHELDFSNEENLFPGQRQTHLLRAQLYAMLLLVEELKEAKERP